MFCKNCGKEISDSAQTCPNCGHPMVAPVPANASDREWLPTLLLCFFLGAFGIHSFYVRKTTVGIIQLLTCGGCGVWVLIDLFLIVTKAYRDNEGRLVIR